MNLLLEWKNTLEMFKPKNLKLLGLVTLNAFKQACKTVFFNIGWWILAFAVMFFVVGGALVFGIIVLTPDLNFVIREPWDPVRSYLSGLVTVIYYNVIFLWCVTIRPSVERKKGLYFLSFAKQFLYLFPLYFFCLLIGYLVLRIEDSFIVAPHLSIYAGVLLMTPAIFFALDSDGSFKKVMHAHWQGLKMLVYALPAYVAIALLYKAIAWAVWQIKVMFNYDYAWWKLLENISFHLLSWLLVPFFICIMSVIYTKRLHDNIDLYK